MKKNLFRMLRSTVAMLLVFCMVAGFVPTAAFAEEAPAKKLVSLGDSMTNGLGLGGGYDATGHQGYLEIDKYSYPALLAEHYGWELTQLAVSCVRAEDLHYILDYGTENAYPGDVWTQTMLMIDERWYEGAEKTAEVYQNAIAEADVVTMSAGNCNLGVYLFDMMLNALGMTSSYGQDYSYATVENALNEIGADADAKALILSVSDELQAYLSAYLSEELVEKLVDRMTYVIANLAIHYAGALDRMVELNPDIEVVVLGLLNTMSGYEMDIISGGVTYHLDFEAMYNIMLDPLNAYMAAMPAAKQLVGAYADAKIYYAEVETIETLALAYQYEYAENEAFYLSRFVKEIAGMMGMSWLTADMVLAYRNAVRGAETDEEKYAAIGTFIYQMGLDYESGMNLVMAVEAYNVFEAYLLSSVNMKPVIDMDQGIYDENGNMSDGFTVALMAMYTRFALASGMSAHPSKQAHRDMCEAIKAAYEGDHTAMDQTAENLKILIEALMPELEALGESYLPILLEQVDALIAEVEKQLETADEMVKAQLEAVLMAAKELKAVVEKAIVDGVNAVVDQLKAAAVALDNAVKAAANCLNDYVVTKYSEIVNTIKALLNFIDKMTALMNYVNEMVNLVKDQLAAAEGAAKAQLEELYNKLVALQKLVKQMIISGSNELKAELVQAVVDVMTAVQNAAKAMNAQAVHQLETLANKIVEALFGIYEGAISSDYFVDEDSYYVAIGDSTAASNSYVDALAAELGVDYKNLAKSGMMVADVYELLKDQKAEIEKADLITVGFGSNSFLDYAIDRAVRLELADRTDAEAPAALDWTVYVGEKGAAKVEEKLAELYNQFAAEGLGVITLSYDVTILGITVTITTDFDLAQLMTVIVESYAYAVTSYAFDLPGIVEEIHAINADAVVAIVGMYNPIGGVSISLGESAFAIGEYADYLVDAANIHNLAYALLTGNAIFVEAAEVETLIVAAGTDGAATVDALSFLQMYINADIEKIMNGDLDTVTAPCGEATNPSAKGHEYIKTQVRNALTILEPCYDSLTDADHNCDICGKENITEHEYTSVVTAPTYAEKGYTTHTCSVCGHSYIDSYVDSLELPAAEIQVARMILGNELAMQFAFNQADIMEGVTYTAVITKAYADGREEVVVEVPQNEWKTNGSYYYVSFNGIAAKEMADDVKVQIFANGAAVSGVYTDSIREYALRQLRRATDADTKTLYVDMLNYGAAAQIYFGYNAENLVNADLTDAEKAYGTETVELENKLVAGTNYGASQLNLASSIQLRVKFNNINSSMKAVVKFTNHMGREIEVEVPGSEFMYSGTVVVVDEIVAADYAQDVTITVYNANGEVVANAVDSVASYIARMSAGDAIYDAVAKYCASAYAYLH